MNGFTLTKHEKQSKGRNGWFSPARVNFLHGPHDTIAIEVWSKNQTGDPPIDLYLTYPDARAFATALLASLPEEEAAKPDPSEAGGNACPKCGEHSFRLQATFAGSVDITFSDDPEDPTDFDVDDSEPTDSEWDGPVECLNCNWSGVLADLVTVTAATAAVVVPSA